MFSSLNLILFVTARSFLRPGIVRNLYFFNLVHEFRDSSFERTEGLSPSLLLHTCQNKKALVGFSDVTWVTPRTSPRLLLLYCVDVVTNTLFLPALTVCLLAQIFRLCRDHIFLKVSAFSSWSFAKCATTVFEASIWHWLGCSASAFDGPSRSTFLHCCSCIALRSVAFLGSASCVSCVKITSWLPFCLNSLESHYIGVTSDCGIFWTC